MRRSYGTLTGNTTITLDLDDNQDAFVLLTQGGSGGYTVTWSGVDVWLTPAGDVPVMKSAIGATDGFQFWRADTVVYGLHHAEAGPAGDTGATGPAGITWRGTYDSDNTYSINDVVYYNGSSYIALQASSSTDAQQPNLAPTYWDPLAAGGGGTTGGGGEYIDNFVRADNANISTNAPNGITYTALDTGTANIVSNTCRDVDTTGANCEYRAEISLPSTDHYCQVTAGTFVTNVAADVEFAAMCRCDASAHTAYMAVVYPQSGPTWKFHLYKIVTGTYTSLGNVTVATPVAGDYIKLACVGTTITGFYNNVQQLQVTDSSITTGTRCGFHLVRSTGTDVALSELRFGT